jgi:hypothetical protein
MRKHRLLVVFGCFLCIFGFSIQLLYSKQETRRVPKSLAIVVDSVGTKPPCPREQDHNISILETSHGGSKHNMKIRSKQISNPRPEVDASTCIERNIIASKQDVAPPTGRKHGGNERLKFSLQKKKTKAPPVTYNETVSSEDFALGRFNEITALGEFKPNLESFTLCKHCATKYWSNVCLWNGTIYRENATSKQYKSWSYAGDMIFPISDLSELEKEPKQFAEAPAFFAWMPCEGNLFHLIFQTLAPLYTLLVHQDLMGRRDFERKMDFYVDRPFGYDVVALRNDSSFRHGSCRSPKYLSMFDLLPVNLEYDFYGDARFRDQLRCYKHAYFGFDERMEHSKMIPVLTFVKNRMIPQERCEALKSAPGEVNVIMIQRHHRRIANMEELTQGLATLKAKMNMRIVALEDLTFMEQLEMFSCWGDVMVGVQGAGMAWGYFMPHGKGMIEIGWKKWECRYDGRFKNHLLPQCIRVPDSGLRVNFTNYMKDTDIFKDKRYVKFAQFSDIPEQDQNEVLAISKKNPYGFTPKYVDVTVPLNLFTSAMRKVVSTVANQ